MPVLSPEEAFEAGSSDTAMPQPHPNLSRTPSVSLSQNSLSLTPGQHNVEVLKELGVSDQGRRKLIEEGAIPGGRDAKL